MNIILTYSPINNTLPKSGIQMHGTSVRFTEMDVIRKTKRQTLLVCLSGTMYQCPCSRPSFQKSPSHLLLNHPY